MTELTVGSYLLTRKILPGDAARGVPELWSGEHAGDLVYVKLWPRRSKESVAIKAMWNREIRSLARLQGYPGASELFVRLRDIDVTDQYYFATIDGGRRLILLEVLANRSNYSWLSNLGEPGRRQRLWEGLLRVGEALSILHADGTLHRSLSPASIFVGPEGQGDFRLSGFEWSLRLAGRDGASSKVVGRPGPVAPELDDREGEYSTATDWFDFGLLAAQVLGAGVQHSTDREHAREVIKKLPTLKGAEREFLLQLIEENPEIRLSSASDVLFGLRNIINSLNITTSGAGRELSLALRLSNELSHTIEKSSGGVAKRDSPNAQRDWVVNDLRGEIRIVARTVPYNHFILKGERFEYRVKQWINKGVPSWEIGFCESVETLPRAYLEDQVFGLGERKLNIQLFNVVSRTQLAIRDRSAPWDRIFRFASTKPSLDAYLRDTYDFFRITQQLDITLTIAQICPVQVLQVQRSESDTVIIVSPVDEPDRNDLARLLQMQSPAEQLMDWFDLGTERVVAGDEEDAQGHRYSFLEGRTLSSDVVPGTWRFNGAKLKPNGIEYRFKSNSIVSLREGILYLAQDHQGSVSQIRRRNKAIEDLRLHEILLRVISDPNAMSHRGRDELPPARAEIPLDQSKLLALDALWKQQPTYAIQGPPGTGKTTLISAFVDRLLSADATAQILLTAHSHHTVDDVRVKIAKLFQGFPPEETPILLRLGGDEDNEHSIKPVTSALMRRLADSDLLKDSPPSIAERVHASADQANDLDGTNPAFRAMQSLIQDAANITFSTSNAGDLAELTRRGRRFDWSVIEEAGKAHGFDMAVALQESHRLLFIGDHKQLPPFNAGIFRRLLADPLRVKKAIQSGEQFAPNLIDSSLVDDEEGRASLEDRCQKWRSMVAFFAYIFDQSTNFQEDDTGPAKTLTDQHRMHPDIADLVGRTFYPDDDGGTILQTPEEARERFAKHPPFDLRSDTWLPDHRIVWCDVPWVQKQKFAIGETDGLFTSPAEARLVVELLQQFRPYGSEKCELQILSPYNDQLKAISQEIAKARQAGVLTEIFDSPFNLDQEKRMGATVDEFQGSEADVVVVSLVRNNGLPRGKSVGFLKEPNRMNVLLSRARHKLIIVGSWNFFQTRTDEITSDDESHAYLGRMMRMMEESIKRGEMSKVDYNL